MSNAKYDVNHVQGIAPLPDVNARPVDYDEEVQKVGINNLELPVKWKDLNDRIVKMKGTFSSYVSIEQGSGRKGINMSRIPFSIREACYGEGSGIEMLKNVAKNVAEKSGATHSYIKVKFDYPMIQQSLRSKDEDGEAFWAHKYYPVMAEIKYNDIDKTFRAFVTLNFTYSSACVCSWELTQHLKEEEGLDGVPHSQRSDAKTTIELDLTKDLKLEDLVNLHRKALITETQLLVKRIDEREFASLNGRDMLKTAGRNTVTDKLEEVHPIHQAQGGLKFVEDAARLMKWSLSSSDAILDWVSILSHHESLHSFSAISVIYKGKEGGLR